MLINSLFKLDKLVFKIWGFQTKMKFPFTYSTESVETKPVRKYLTFLLEFTITDDFVDLSFYEIDF